MEQRNDDSCKMKILFETGGGFDGGLGFYPPNPHDFEQPSCKGCLVNAIKLVIILSILFFVAFKLFG